jgi:hypothetical protein
VPLLMMAAFFVRHNPGSFPHQLFSSGLTVRDMNLSREVPVTFFHYPLHLFRNQYQPFRLP